MHCLQFGPKTCTMVIELLNILQKKNISLSLSLLLWIENRVNPQTSLLRQSHLGHVANASCVQQPEGCTEGGLMAFNGPVKVSLCHAC